MRSSLGLIILVGLLGIISAHPPTWVQQADRAVYKQFSQYLSEFKKSYADQQETARRFLNFKENMDKAAILNMKHNGTAIFGPTIFSDLTASEFAEKYLSAAIPPNEGMNYTRAKTYGAAPPSVDWVAQKMVTPVKDQGQICGSCWSFTAVGEMESQLLRKNRGTFQLSTQQLVDCDPYDTGCQGGFYDRAWSYIYKAGGVMNWKDYPYQAAKYTCRFNAAKIAAKLTSGNAITTGSSSAQIYDFVANHGPAAAALDATLLQNYQRGILNQAAAYCPNLNHAVLIVGYNQAANSLTVRNSWGTSWGEQGYFRITPTSCLINQHVMGSSTA